MSLIGISIVAVLFLFWLIYFKESPSAEAASTYPQWINGLDSFNALMNSFATCFLLLGFRAIKLGHKTEHSRWMKAAFAASSLFLISYITYHYYHGDSSFQGQGALLRFVYFSILISHILLSIIVLPMVLITFYFALSQRWERHRALARWTFPLWLYVSATGVAIYFFLNV